MILYSCLFIVTLNFQHALIMGFVSTTFQPKRLAQAGDIWLRNVLDCTYNSTVPHIPSYLPSQYYSRLHVCFH